MKKRTKKAVGGISLVFATLFMLSGLVVTVFHPAILPEQKPEKTFPLTFSAEKQAEKKESVDLKKQLETALELLEALGGKEEMEENDLAFNEGTRYCLEEMIANLRARLPPSNSEEVCDSP